MPFTIVKRSITSMPVDAIVNAANRELLHGGGVCGAIFRAAGADALQAACNALAPVATGCAAITAGFALRAKHIIHAVGPIYDRRNPAESERLLRSAYLEALRLADEHGCESIAFPLISSGIYGYPKAEALTVATAAIREFLLTHDMDVYLAVLDGDAIATDDALIADVARYMDGVMEPPFAMDEAVRAPLYASLERRERANATEADGLPDFIRGIDEPFSAALLRLIDEKGRTDVEVYKRANIDRKLFSKIRTGRGYTPGKRTVLALAVALELDLDETDALLRRAGYALSHSRKDDVIIEYFIINGRYDIFELNEVLFKYDQPLLGG